MWVFLTSLCAGWIYLSAVYYGLSFEFNSQPHPRRLLKTCKFPFYIHQPHYLHLLNNVEAYTIGLILFYLIFNVNKNLGGSSVPDCRQKTKYDHILVLFGI